MEWEISDDENRLGELLDSVDEHGPQQIRRHGKIYVVAPAPSTQKPSRNRLVEILVDGPSWDDVPIERIRGHMRDVDL